jgi:hypothetical protein
MKKKMILVIDVETANMLDDPLVYDMGMVMTDKEGKIYEQHSFLVRDVFEDGQNELMTSAYYAKKIPLYLEKLNNKEIVVKSFSSVRFFMKTLMEKYGCTTVAAYNANFDKTALNTTQRYLTSSKYRYFFPYNTEIICIWNMACQVLFTQKRFQKKAIANNWVSAKGNLQTSAEIGFQYITKDSQFQEEHTGLADVLIEIQIMVKCFQQKKKMTTGINRWCWKIPTSVYKKSLVA